MISGSSHWCGSRRVTDSSGSNGGNEQLHTSAAEMLRECVRMCMYANVTLMCELRGGRYSAAARPRLQGYWIGRYPAPPGRCSSLHRAYEESPTLTRYMNPTVSAFSWESGLDGGGRAVYRCKRILATHSLRNRITGTPRTPRLPPPLTVINRPVKFTRHTINFDSCSSG